MNRIFITGGTSSIGVHLIKLLLQEENILHVLVRSKRTTDFMIHPRIIQFEGNLNSIESLTIAMQGCNQIYHLAANTSIWLSNPNEYFKTNVQGTQNVLDAAIKNGISRVVFTSSAGIYGPSLNGIINETKTRNLDFFNEYESSKVLAELKIKEYVLEHNLDVVIVSPTRVYGPILFGPISSTTILIDKFVNHHWCIYPGSGKEIGNYAYIEDVAQGHLLAMKHGRKGANYILGGENCTYFDFFQTLSRVAKLNRRMYIVPFFFQKTFAWIQFLNARILGIKPSITPKWLAKGSYNWEVSSQKAISELGYTITPLELGLKKTVRAISKSEEQD